MVSADVRAAGSTVDPSRVHEVLAGSILVDGFDLVLDLQRSAGSRLVDARDGSVWLDLFTFFASSALGMNHPALTRDPAFARRLLSAAYNKPSCSDVYTVELAEFVQTFRRVLGDPALPHLFFIDGGALAVENALKVAFDWKSRRNEAAGRDRRLGTKVLHLEHAFHGRSGYTLSLTNTDPAKTDRYPTFDWPRIPSPARTADAEATALAEQAALAAARQAFEAAPHDIACFVAEPIQAEGGDRHLRAEFLRAMQDLCLEFDALFVLDEVQTGCGITGTAWAYQQLGLAPDVVAFGKKTQVCGVMAGRRVDDVAENVFAVSSRINSTFGGNLTDMVRTTRILETIEAEHLVEGVPAKGQALLAMLSDLAHRDERVGAVRGRGLLVAFDLPDAGLRDQVLARLRERERVLLLGCGPCGIRFRPALTVALEDLGDGVAALSRVLRSCP